MRLGGGLPSGQLQVSGDGGQPLNFFLGTGRIFLPGRLNDPCRGRRWGLVHVVTPHPVIKLFVIKLFVFVSLRATPPYAHECNGIAERSIQTIFDVTRALIQHANMPNNMWPVSLHHAVYLRNSAPSQVLGGGSPMQMLGAQAIQVSALYTFGVKCFVKIDNASRTALQP